MTDQGFTPPTETERKVAATRHLTDVIETEIYYGFNLRMELLALIDSDPDRFDSMTLFFEGVQGRRLAEKAVIDARKAAIIEESK